MYRIVFSKINIFICFLFATACSSGKKEIHLPYYNTADFTPLFITSAKEVQQKINHTISSFTLTDQHGKKITEKEVEGKIHIANFIFTSCGRICPVMITHMKMVQKEFQNNPEVVMLSFSVTPWIDSVRRLKMYADNNDITSPNWHLLTGSRTEIYTLARQSYFAEEDLGFSKDSSQFLHTEHIILVDRRKRIRAVYNGTLQLEAEQLIKDIKELLKEEVQ